ncbi:WhiB family transcriptional regulator [Streptomyces sp. NPDC006798]|uniref:WhiB family transcriptional regulator n=1 Tax=Streptomyces sp. NPDC006798 TaxID=3155462 RepID=UPI0033F23E1C
MRYITTNDDRPIPRGIADHSWHARSACRSLTPAEADRLFFPLPRAHKAISEAKSICSRCPVKKDCFNSAIDSGAKEGIWGGLTEKERRAWQKKISQRLDYERVRSAFLGRDVHLSTAEREAVTRHAYVRGWSPERLAYALRLDLDYARDLMREAAHAVEDRDRYWDLYDATAEDQDDSDPPEDTGGDDEAADAEPDEEPAEEFVPVARHIHTQALITALGKAA